MSAFELTVLIFIISAFTIFAGVLAWVSRADGKMPAAPNTMPAVAAARSRTGGRFGRIRRASSA